MQDHISKRRTQSVTITPDSRSYIIRAENRREYIRLNIFLQKLNPDLHVFNNQGAISPSPIMPRRSAVFRGRRDQSCHSSMTSQRCNMSSSPNNRSTIGGSASKVTEDVGKKDGLPNQNSQIANVSSQSEGFHILELHIPTLGNPREVAACYLHLPPPADGKGDLPQ